MINWGTIIISVVSFLLGLVSNLFVQWWADRKRLNRINGALKLHLKDIILKECPFLRSEFDRIIVNIQSLSRTEMGFKSFKTFDGEIYKANNPSDYYQIYGSDHNKFDKLVSIYAIISFLKDNMPFKLHKNYLKEVSENLHDTINQGISINQLFKESPFLDGLRSNYIAACSGLINEIDTLTQLIKEFIEQL
jgi:hypothetical protein